MTCIYHKESSFDKIQELITLMFNYIEKKKSKYDN